LEIVDREAVVILRKTVAKLSAAALDRFVSKACKAASVDGTVNVMVTTNREMRSLNHRFRGKDKPTDVLSFPPLQTGVDTGAGDIAISGEIASQNASTLGHTPAEEVKILALHGVLHLAGYDHDRDRGEMARKESRLRRTLGLPDALIERNSDNQTVKRGRGSARSARKR
jgi:probable rRNA maturation factor